MIRTDAACNLERGSLYLNESSKRNDLFNWNASLVDSFHTVPVKITSEKYLFPHQMWEINKGKAIIYMAQL